MNSTVDLGRNAAEVARRNETDQLVTIQVFHMPEELPVSFALDLTIQKLSQS
jgi:hypothetical protein